ncbi:MAG: glycoside hydrolase family 127 protein [Lachnospiraceae bacterium]|nr:glycoside hydrolase family 127 protein [Lachnospiraceae bacterium]
MDWSLHSSPLSLRDIQVTDDFWKHEMELVRTEVLPYQWAALNDQVEGAAPSYCMRNFRLAGKRNRERAAQGDAFKEPKFTLRGFEALPEDPAHPGEQFYGFVFQDSDFSKWIEAVGYSLTQHPDLDLEQLADDAIDIVCAAQQEDGYLDTCYILGGRDKTFSNLKDHHELYCFGHLVEGAVAYYQATGKDRLLKAAERFADFVADSFGPEEGKRKGYPGHEIAEMALVRLYEVTGNQSYLNLSQFFINQRGTRPYYFDKEHPEEVKPGHENELRYEYNQAHLPVREQTEAVGHSVRAVYLYSGMADIARLTQDESLYRACERLWDNIVTKKMYITGGIGSTHLGEAFTFAYDLPNDTAYAETCASIGLVFFARRMLEIRPDSKYADVMERALYNGILSGMALDGKSFFYVNPLEVNPEASKRDERKYHVKPVRQKWFGCACCPPNIARLLSSIAAYAYTETEDTLFVHLYMGSRVAKKITAASLPRSAQGEVSCEDLGSEGQGSRSIDVTIDSAFPWDGAVKIKVRAKDTPFRLALRIPDWAKTDTSSPDISLCSGSNAQIELKDGYLYIQKDWGEEDTIELHFPMEVKLIAANANVREDIGKVAVTRGPVVFCLEEADNGKDLHLLTLDPSGEPSVSDIEICGEPAKSILWPGFRQKTNAKPGESEKLYHSWQREEKEAVSLQFIPYYMWANRSAQGGALETPPRSARRQSAPPIPMRLAQGGAEMSVWVRI